MSYKRVIPRDFFNEAKLLKCMGQLSLKIHDEMLPDGLKIEIEETGEPFQIERDDSSGDISVHNYTVTINDRVAILRTNLNSRHRYPLYCSFHDTDPVIVFDDNGDFTTEFENLKNIL